MADQVQAEDSAIVNFTGDCGETSGRNSATSVGMAPGQQASVNGAPPSNCVKGNDDSKAFSITLVNNAGFYSYQVQVEAQGPDSIFGGSFYLGFQDETGDIYHLSIFSSRRELHTVSYNSSKPNIVKIYWSNNSFSFDSADLAGKTVKPDFQVVSPVIKDDRKAE